VPTNPPLGVGAWDHVTPPAGCGGHVFGPEQSFVQVVLLPEEQAEESEGDAD
jgi:hypothetical protein